MPIRITGMNSGLDTESIITELVKAKSEKKNSLIKAQTKLQWKQDAWKELNKKVYSFYSKSLSNMRLEGDYYKKVTKASNASAVTIITGTDAVNGVQNLKVESLAKSGYLTGAELEGQNKPYDGSSKLAGDLGITSGSKIELTAEGKTTTIEIDETTTINSFVNQLKKAGVNASFDAENQRFFISAKSTGEENDFSFNTLDSAGEDAMQKLGLSVTSGSGATRIHGEDAKILLNGAEFKSKTNTFSINGLTITANMETKEDFTITTEEDTDGIYEKIKSFLKEYNALINEMDALYNAESSKGYEPLTDEEKEALSEKEIEKWEEKIKKSILRKDSTLSSVAGAMKEIMLQGVTINGTKKYLSDFGINTLGYFNAPDNEKNSYHIDGDSDDEYTSTNNDLLKTAITKNPDEVIKFFTQLSKNLYEKVGDMMKKTKYSSSFTLYDDVSMKEEYDDYKNKIAKQEEKITDFEDRYYKKFSAMETALAKMQSKESAISGLFGM